MGVKMEVIVGSPSWLFWGRDTSLEKKKIC